METRNASRIAPPESLLIDMQPRAAADYANGNRGPWPQPSPRGLAPAVPHFAAAEADDFMRHVGRRYLRVRYTYRPVAWSHAWRTGGLRPLDDEILTRVLTQSVFGRFLSTQLDPRDLADFAPYMDRRGLRWFKADFSGVDQLEPLPGTFVAPTTILFGLDDGGSFEVVAMRCGELMLTPADGNAWALARYFALNGASYQLVTGIHGLLHFPMDAINAITKAAVPTRHVLYQLLEPHMRFSLPLNDRVLESSRSVLANDQRYDHCVFTSTSAGIERMMRLCYQGRPGNSAYPAYRFGMPAWDPAVRYGRFVRPLYETIREFVREVVASIPSGDPVVRAWGDHIHAWVPGFPDGAALADPDVLAEALAFYITDVSVLHATDHHSFASLPLWQVPMRLRVPPPATRDVPAFDPRDLASPADLMRQKTCHHMFFKPNNVTLLHNVDYAFPTPALRKLQARFLQALRVTHAHLDMPDFIPLEEISASIQY